LPSIFISYSREDLRQAQWLEQQLESQEGVEVWRDEKNLRVGQQWTMELGEAIKNQGYFILLWSASAQASHFVTLEWNNAIALKKIILPCLLDETPLPPFLAATQTLSLNEPNDFIDQLVGVLKSDALADRSKGTPLSILKGEVVCVEQDGGSRPAAAFEVLVKPFQENIRTDSYGQFTVTLPITARAGDSITYDVQHGDWRVWIPAGGKDRIPRDLTRELVAIQLLPKGSKKFWTDAFIETFIEQTASVAKIQRQSEIQPRDIDFGPMIRDWAVKYGFTPQEARGKIEEWVAEVQKTESNFYKLGLAAFAEKNFTRAAELFTESGNLHAQQVDQLTKEIESSKMKAVRDYRKAGDAHSSNYRFIQALQAYELALKYIQKEQSYALWADVQMEIAHTRWALGIRVEGQAAHQYLASAKDAYSLAEEGYMGLGYVREQAAAQVGIGLIFSEQGIRTGGEEGQALLAQAVAAYRAALEVRTREQLPQDWAMTQNNLGNTLSESGIRTGGEEGQALLAQAVAAYRAALVVRTKESLAPQWAQTHNNLAETAMVLGEWEQVVTSYRNVLELYPDYADAYLNTNAVLHEKLFRFAEAFSLNEEWLKTHLDDESANMNFAEVHLTTGRFSDAEHRFAELLNNPKLDAQTANPLRLLRVASLAGQKKMGEVAGYLKEIRDSLGQQPQDFTLSWPFEGTKHFIGQHEAFAGSREWLLPLLEAFGGKPRDDMLAAVEAAQAKLGSPPSP